MKKYQIQPVQWQRDKNPVTQYTVLGSYDDYSTGATFQVALLDAEGNQVDQVNVACRGTDYTDRWNGNRSFPATYVAEQLQFTPIQQP